MKELIWSLETMRIINELTPDIKGKAFSPDWFLLRQRLEEFDRCSIKPNDNNDPITEEWLLSIGFKPIPSDMGPKHADHYKKGRLIIWEFNNTGEWLFRDADWIGVKTRHELRMLAELAKVELNE